jgi:hypothetical protein
LNFFYKFYTKVRAINTEEVKLLNDIKPNLGFLCPLAISETWYTKND